MATFAQIDEATGFARGEPFTTPDEVRGFFTVANLAKRGYLEHDQCTLDEYAHDVVTHGWHMAPFSAVVVDGVRVSFGGTLAEIWHWLQGFRSTAACTLVRQTASPTLVNAEHRPGAKLSSGTVRQVMDWIDTAVKVEKTP